MNAAIQPGAAPRKKRRKWPWILLAVIVFAVVAGVAGGSGGEGDKKDSNKASTPNQVTETQKSEAGEVVITACEKEPTLGWVKIEGTATNGSSKRSDYYIDIVVEDASGNQVESTFATATNVEPDQTAKWEAPSTEDWQDGFTCRVVDVQRDASV